MAKPHTLVHELIDWAKRTPSAVALRERAGAGGWTEWTWADYLRDVREVAKGLIALGHKEGQCVALIGANRPEWVICELAIMAARGVPASIYTTNTTPQVAYIVEHSQAEIAICDGAEQLAKYEKAQADGDMNVKHIVSWDEVEGDHPLVQTLDALKALGREQPDDELDRRIAELTDTETAMLIYTSGTTGVPKGAELNHRGMLTVSRGILDRFPHVREGDGYIVVSYLPLCHAAEQAVTTFGALETGGAVTFCPDLKQIKDFMTEVRPTLFLGVPRVWEKFEAAMMAKFAEATGLKAKLLAWARRVELDCFKRQCRTGQRVITFSRKLANALVLSKVRAALGLDRLKLAVTGAAPISMRTLEFFASLGLPVYEGYGMTETSAVASVVDYHRPMLGSVGKPLAGVEVKIADDGEILLKGPNMVPGYFRMPEKTAELYAHGDDWLCTGDLGRVDDEGNIFITGRKKDLLITAGGKNVAPAELEAFLKQIPGVGQAVVVGDRQPYLSALIILDAEGLPDLCSRLGLPETPITELADNDALRSYLDEEIKQRCNAQVARYQTIKRFQVLPVEFTVDTGELTPTMKIKRNVVTEKFASEIDALYAAPRETAAAGS